MLRKEARERYQNLSEEKNKKRKKAHERYQNFLKRKKRQHDRERNKIFLKIKNKG